MSALQNARMGARWKESQDFSSLSSRLTFTGNNLGLPPALLTVNTNALYRGERVEDGGVWPRERQTKRESEKDRQRQEE